MFKAIRKSQAQKIDLIKTVKKGDFVALKKALKNEFVDINVKEWREGRTALMIAASCGHVECVEALSRSGAELDVQGKFGDTALILAVFHGFPECAKALIQAGAGLDVQEQQGITALMFSSYHYKSIESFEALIKAGANPNISNERGATALMSAAASNDTGRLDALIKAGANLDAQNNEGETALMDAARRNCVECVKALIKVGAGLNIQDNKGNTALTITNHPESIQILTQALAGKKISPQKHKVTDAASEVFNFFSRSIKDEISQKVDQRQLKGATVSP